MSSPLVSRRDADRLSTEPRLFDRNIVGLLRSWNLRPPTEKFMDALGLALDTVAPEKGFPTILAALGVPRIGKAVGLHRLLRSAPRLPGTYRSRISDFLHSFELATPPTTPPALAARAQTEAKAFGKPTPETLAAIAKVKRQPPSLRRYGLARGAEPVAPNANEVLGEISAYYKKHNLSSAELRSSGVLSYLEQLGGRRVDLRELNTFVQTASPSVHRLQTLRGSNLAEPETSVLAIPGGGTHTILEKPRGQSSKYWSSYEIPETKKEILFNTIARDQTQLEKSAGKTTLAQAEFEEKALAQGKNPYDLSSRKTNAELDSLWETIQDKYGLPKRGVRETAPRYGEKAREDASFGISSRFFEEAHYEDYGKIVPLIPRTRRTRNLASASSLYPQDAVRSVGQNLGGFLRGADRSSANYDWLSEAYADKARTGRWRPKGDTFVVENIQSEHMQMEALYGISGSADYKQKRRHVERTLAKAEAEQATLLKDWQVAPPEKQSIFQRDAESLEKRIAGLKGFLEDQGFLAPGVAQPLGTDWFKPLFNEALTQSAKEGKRAFGWTTGSVQAQRWNSPYPTKNASRRRFFSSLYDEEIPNWFRSRFGVEPVKKYSGDRLRLVENIDSEGKEIFQLYDNEKKDYLMNNIGGTFFRNRVHVEELYDSFNGAYWEVPMAPLHKKIAEGHFTSSLDQAPSASALA